jgi:hypothetical protein
MIPYGDASGTGRYEATGAEAALTTSRQRTISCLDLGKRADGRASPECQVWTELNLGSGTDTRAPSQETVDADESAWNQKAPQDQRDLGMLLGIRRGHVRF